MIPFNDYDLFQILQKQNLQVEDRVEKFSNEEIVANDLDILADFVYEEFHIDPVVIFDEDLSKRQSNQIKIEKQSNENR